MVWDRNDLIRNSLQELVGTSNQLSQNLKSKRKLVINSLHTLRMSIKRFLDEGKFLFYLSFTRGYIIFQGDLLLQIPEGAILARTDVVGLYPSIPNKTGLKALIPHCFGTVTLMMFFIWTHGKEKFASFINLLNNYDPNIKLTHEPNKEHIPILDLNMNLSGNKLSTNLYIKSTDRHQYLHYTSSHTEYTKS